MKLNSKLFLSATLTWCLTALIPVQAETDDTSLAGRNWLAEDINGKGVVDILQTTIEFVEAGKIAGNAGCNRYFGTVTITDKTIEVKPLGMTRMMCPESIMNQEQAFTQVLPTVKRWDIKNGLLFMYADENKAVLRFSEIKKK